MIKTIIYIGSSEEDLEGKLYFEKYKNNISRKDVIFMGKSYMEDEEKFVLIYNIFIK